MEKAEKKQGTLSERLKLAMAYAKINQTELAEKARTTQQNISKILKTNSCTLDNLKLFSKVLNVSTDYLLGLTDTMFVEPDKQAVATYTGLSDEALLCLFNNYTDVDKAILSSMITSDNFLYLIRSISIHANKTIDQKKADICEKVFSKIEKRSGFKREEFYKETKYVDRRGSLSDISLSVKNLPNFYYLDPDSDFFEIIEKEYDQSPYQNYRSEAYRYFSEFVEKGFDLGLIAKDVSNDLATERIGDEAHFYDQIEKRVVALIKNNLFVLTKQVVEDYSDEGDLIITIVESTKDNTKVIDSVSCILDEFFGDDKKR